MTTTPLHATPSAPLIVYAAAPDARAAFSVKSVARLLEVSQDTVHRLIKDGRLEVLHVGDRTWRIPAWSLEAFLAPDRRVSVEAEGQIA